MNKPIVALILFLFMSTTPMIAQDLTDYRWENRLILVLADDLQKGNYVNQIKEFEKHAIGLQERKLVVICATSTSYKIGIQPKSNWKVSQKIYNQYKNADTAFEVILIGLDGGIKARKTEVYKIEDLFAIIDGMPMRRAEIKNR